MQGIKTWNLVRVNRNHVPIWMLPTFDKITRAGGVVIDLERLDVNEAKFTVYTADRWQWLELWWDDSTTISVWAGILLRHVYALKEDK